MGYSGFMKTDQFLNTTGVKVPLICGPMYPCSNPELVAAVSDAGGLGVVQPMTLTSICGHDFRAGLQLIRKLTDRPIGLNLLLEHSFRRYQDRMDEWIGIALEENVRFFITALGHPRRVAQRIHQQGGVLYHDVVGRGFAVKAADAGVDGLICVNNHAGGHAGRRSAETLYDELSEFGLPLVCAGGIGTPQDFRDALDMGYAAVQMGTRFIASRECNVHPDYQAAILKATAEDIVMTDKISGVPVSIIGTPTVMAMGLKASGLARKLLRHPRTKNWMRAWYLRQSLKKLPGAAFKGSVYSDYFQAGKSVQGIDEIQSAAEIVQAFAAVLDPSEKRP
jgi:nitronate monooxygenase